MITDAIVSLLVAILTPVLALLPSGHLALPDPGGIAAALSGLDGLVPILGVLRLGAVMLAALGVFLGVRVVVFLRHFLLP